MPGAPLSQVLRHLRRLTAAAAGGEATDAELLGRFVADRDEAAFEGLVRRHGGLVWGLCRRLLQHPQDAEDAFQATFLVLARKAASISRREQLSNWLYGVAYRVAVRARACSARWRSQQRADVPDMPTTDPPPDLIGR